MSQFRWNWYTEIYTKQLNVETALAAANYPLSGSYIDVSAFERFSILIHAGALDTACTFQVYQDTSATQTADIKVITSATRTVGTGDDNEDFIIEVGTDQLDTANGFKFVTVTVTGPTGNDYASFEFYGYAARTKPVTQPATLPSDNQVSIVA
jgi:hypothetical protein